MPINDSTLVTSHDLLKRIHKDRAALSELWGELTNEQMVGRPGPQKDWSVKDMVAHITWWESFILDRVIELIRGVRSEPAEHQDVLNARAYEEHKDSSLTEVLAAFNANGSKLETLISSLNDEQINKSAYYPTYDGVALLPILRAGTFGHYPSHMGDLRTYVESLKTSLS